MNDERTLFFSRGKKALELWFFPSSFPSSVMAIDIFKSLLYADDEEVFFGINPCHSVVLIGMGNFEGFRAHILRNFYYLIG